jgi:hypothetical protein
MTQEEIANTYEAPIFAADRYEAKEAAHGKG